jgi:hypothetical protein
MRILIVEDEKKVADFVAELSLVSAEITYADTQFEYLLQRSVLNFQTGALH